VYQLPVKILAVDDDPDILDAVTLILQSQGYEVVTVRSGSAALAALKAEEPDLMILDLLMPGMDGVAVYRELQKPGWSRFRDVPILALTSVREETGRRRYEIETGAELHLVEYLEKPIAPETLLYRVSELIRRRKGLMVAN
ncbi:MAG: response regulator, partial [Chloroflexota bacterium]